MEDLASRETVRTALAMAAVLVVATALRVAGLNAHSLWFDEVITMTVARQPGASAALGELQRSDATRAPLHPLLLQRWIGLFGPSDLSGRALSALLGVATVALVYWVGREADPRGRSALWASMLAAISPLGVQYSQEVRMYGLLVLLTCLCWGLHFSFRRSATLGKQAAFAASITAMIYCHPLGGLMAIALALGYLGDRRQSKLSWTSWIAIQGVVGLGVAPWAIHYLDHPPDPKTMPPGRLLSWPRLFIGGHSATLWVCLPLIVVGLLELRPREDSGIGGLQTKLRAVLRRVRLVAPETGLGLLSWFLVPPALLYLYSRARHPIFGPLRYFVFVGPGYLLLLARGLDRLPRFPRTALLGVALVASAGALRSRVYDPDVKPDWRGAAAVMRREDPRALVVMFCEEPHMYPPTVEYYVDRSTRVIAVHRYSRELSSGSRRPAPSAWFLSDRFDGALVREVPEPVKTLYVREKSWSFHRVRLVHCRLRADAEVAHR